MVPSWITFIWSSPNVIDVILELVTWSLKFKFVSIGASQISICVRFLNKELESGQNSNVAFSVCCSHVGIFIWIDQRMLLDIAIESDTRKRKRKLCCINKVEFSRSNDIWRFAQVQCLVWTNSFYKRNLACSLEVIRLFFYKYAWPFADQYFWQWGSDLRCKTFCLNGIDTSTSERTA